MRLLPLALGLSLLLTGCAGPHGAAPVPGTSGRVAAPTGDSGTAPEAQPRKASAPSASSAPDTTTLAALRAAVAHPARRPADRARDIWRRPVETLGFLGFRPDLTVLEISPGAGWYTDVLGAALGPEGRLYAAHFPAESDSEYFRKTRAAFLERLAGQPWAARVTVTEFAPLAGRQPAPDGSVDLVLTFRNVHNWYMQGGDTATAAAFRQFFAALRPGGTLGVVEHRLPESRPDAEMNTSGYMKTSYVIRQAEAAGFVLEATSEINANPRDTTDHPRGVWTLPPTLRLGEVDRVRYLAIGESDRMTLRFRKPSN